jgi:hypothetical protein
MKVAHFICRGWEKYAIKLSNPLVEAMDTINRHKKKTIIHKQLASKGPIS